MNKRVNWHNAVTRGERMAAARHAAGMTQRDLAAASGISRTSIGRIESGNHIGNFETLLILADALHIGLDEYIGREVKPK